MATIPITTDEGQRSKTRRRVTSRATAILAAMAVSGGLVATVAALKLNLATPSTPSNPSTIASLPSHVTHTARVPIVHGAIDSLQKAEAAAQAAPSDPEAQAALGFAFLQAARETGDPTDYGRAEVALNAATALDPRNADGIIGQGSLALSRHRFATALEFGIRAKLLNPSVSAAYGVIADAQIELGRYDDALTTVQTMVDLRPDISSYSRVSYLRELHGDLPGAISAMELAVSAAGPAAENTEYVRVQLGNLYFAIGDLANARLTYERSLLALPEYHFALAGLARVEAATRHYPEAIALYRRATARLPLPELVIGLGETLQAAGFAQEAADQYALVTAMQQLFAANGVRTDMEMASFFADHGDPARAVELARAAFKERPSVFAADTLAWALYRDGHAADAAPYVKDALRLGTRNSRLLYHAGIIELALGQRNLARRHLQAALALNAHFSALDAPRAAAALATLD